MNNMIVLIIDNKGNYQRELMMLGLFFTTFLYIYASLSGRVKCVRKPIKLNNEQ